MRWTALGLKLGLRLVVCSFLRRSSFQTGVEPAQPTSLALRPPDFHSMLIIALLGNKPSVFRGSWFSISCRAPLPIPERLSNRTQCPTHYLSAIREPRRRFFLSNVVELPANQWPTLEMSAGLHDLEVRVFERTEQRLLLDVKCQEVLSRHRETRDRCCEIDSVMWPMPVVEVIPRRQSLAALL